MEMCVKILLFKKLTCCVLPQLRKNDNKQENNNKL